MLEAAAFQQQADDDEYESDFPYPRVLDLYAGSGALGIEALSRGAEHVDFVESNASVRAVIAENLRRTGFTPQGTIHGRRAEAAAQRCLDPMI